MTWTNKFFSFYTIRSAAFPIKSISPMFKRRKQAGENKYPKLKLISIHESWCKGTTTHRREAGWQCHERTNKSKHQAHNWITWLVEEDHPSHILDFCQGPWGMSKAVITQQLRSTGLSHRDLLAFRTPNVSLKWHFLLESPSYKAPMELFGTGGISKRLQHLGTRGGSTQGQNVSSTSFYLYE